MTEYAKLLRAGARLSLGGPDKAALRAALSERYNDPCVHLGELIDALHEAFYEALLAEERERGRHHG